MKECRFAVHIPANRNRPDVHLIKERIHLPTGEVVPNLRFVKEMKRPVWFTKHIYRNHEQKKEWEDVDKLDKYMVTQSTVRDTVAELVGTKYSRDSLRNLCKNPYVYGADVKSSVFIKQMYAAKYPNTFTPYTVAGLDIETDVSDEQRRILMVTVLMDGKTFTAVTEEFLASIPNPLQAINAAIEKYIPEHKETYKKTIELVRNEVECVARAFDMLHEWQPDLLAIWNMDYDIPTIMNRLIANDIKPVEIMSDPSVPTDMRICNYKRGQDRFVNTNGKGKPLDPSEQWHTLELTASFYVVDAMCIYRRLRLAKSKESSYKLDSILDKELGIRKLSFSAADHLKDKAWHAFMQTRYPVEYVVYNIFDCISMDLLDKKTTDLTITFPMAAQYSDFSDYKSLPKGISDDFFFDFLNDDAVVLAAVGPRPEIEYVTETIQVEEDDDDPDEEKEERKTLATMGLRDWILTLPSMTCLPGIRCVYEDPNMQTYIYTHGFDSDSVSAYPTGIIVLNISKETTVMELVSMDGVDELDFRRQNLNLLAGPVNAIEYCVNMFNFPKPESLLEMFEADIKQGF